MEFRKLMIELEKLEGVMLDRKIVSVWTGMNPHHATVDLSRLYKMGLLSRKKKKSGRGYDYYFSKKGRKYLEYIRSYKSLIRSDYDKMLCIDIMAFLLREDIYNDLVGLARLKDKPSPLPKTSLTSILIENIRKDPTILQEVEKRRKLKYLLLSNTFRDPKLYYKHLLAVRFLESIL